MAKTRHTIPIAVHLLLIRDSDILLLRRANTDYECGNYSVVAGHVDGNESVSRAMQREAMEEAGISIERNDLETVCVMHRLAENGRESIDYFFVAKKWSGDIQNMEPHKCDDLSFFPINSLPQNTINYIRRGIEEGYLQKNPFIEYGWASN